MTEDQPYTNKLIHESSPYLLQHAHNPVEWHPWGEEALKKAQKEDKMLIISIGYAACHWCHVMEHESFEDTVVAQIMNENFVCIKVDREERPDVDDVYMTACHMSSGGNCGWPLNAFAMPDGRPVWAGTYFPKNNWINILNQFSNLKANEEEQLEQYAVKLTQGIQNSEQLNINTGKQKFSRDSLDSIAAAFLSNIDFNLGGRMGSPKFPMPNNYEFLLNYHFLTGKERTMKAVSSTLDNMAMGGIYDQIGGGFARYSVDKDWIVPHFEKMLYDNGQLISLYSKAYQFSKEPLYKNVVIETLEYIKREMTHKDGGFYSSLDADSEGEEGKFYVWTKSEIDAAFNDPEKSEIFCDYYEANDSGNWEHGKNILYRRKSSKSIARKHKISEDTLEAIIKEGKESLFRERSTRIRPGLDDKILTSWNALMLKGYIDAYRTFGDQEYLDIALSNAHFIEQNMLQKDFRLNRNYKDGKSVINAFLDDYALSIQAFIALYEVTFDEKWLDLAKGLADYAIEHFFDDSSAMFNYTSDIDPPLIARKKEISDNVIPASNSSMARGLLHLGELLYQEEYISTARQMMHNISETILSNRQPNFFSNWCQLYTDLAYPPFEVVIIGEDYEAIRKEMQQNFLPNVLFVGGKKEGNLELLKNRLVKGQTTIYVCQNKVCKLPVTEVEEALKLME